MVLLIMVVGGIAVVAAEWFLSEIINFVRGKVE